MSTVKVKVTKEGNVITQNKNNPEYGFFLVETAQAPVVFGNGWANVQRSRQALVSMSFAALEKFASDGLTIGGKNVVLFEGLEIPGKIAMKESVNQIDLFGVKDQATGETVLKVEKDFGKKYRSAAHKEANIPFCTGDGEPIYQKKFFTDDLNDQDILVATGNREDIDQFTADQKAMGNEFLVAGFKKAPVAGKKPVAVK